MIPRVFVSSTYFDLKHVRERLEKFIENYGFEAVLFESDKVTYQHGKPIDQSAYYEVGLCHIMILIIGGRYGTPITSNTIEDERKKYDEEFISITRKEFETSVSKNIPVLIFVDKNVMSEYETYKENQDFFDELYSNEIPQNLKKKFKFAHVDHINVFKFLDVVRIQPLKTFEKVEEIENYLKLQFSGLFYLYLESLKKKSEDNKILDTISELNNITLRMNEMLNSVGKEILGKDKDEYERVIDNQLSMLLDFYAEQFSSSISFKNLFTYDDVSKMDLDSITRVIYENALTVTIPKLEKWDKFDEYEIFNDNVDRQVLDSVQKAINVIDPRIILTKLYYRKLNRELKQKVLPFIKNEADYQKLFNKLKYIISNKLDDLPF